MDNFLYAIREILDPVGIVIGIIISIPVFWTWWEVTFGQKRRRRIWLNEVRRCAGNRPAILIVDLLPRKNIRTSVEGFDDMFELAQDIRKVSAKIISAGADSVHLFYAGPVVPPALIGAELGNACRVLLYQHSGEGYVNWGPLCHDI